MSKFQFGRLHLGVVVLTLSCLLTSVATADFASNFEGPTYTAGSNLPGQNGWYTPDSGGDPHSVFAYAGNPLGLPVNPTGGSQFAGLSTSGAVFGRSQRAVDFSGSSVWTVSYDVAHGFSGTLPGTQNLASLSSQLNPTNAAHRSFIALHAWSDPATAANWNAQFNVFDAAGTSTPNLSPGAAWNNLALNNWYRESITFDFTSNQVLSVSITDLTTNLTNSFAPTDWYLNGGSTGGGLPIPTEMRLFAGGTTAGQISGFDNINVTAIPEPGSVLVLLSAGLFGVLGRRREGVAV